MSVPPRLYKIVVINLVLLVGLNFFAGLLARYYPRITGMFSTGRSLGDDRWTLPNYTDKDRAFQIFKEFGQLRTTYKPFVAWTRAPFQGDAITIDANGDRVHQAPANTPPTAPVARFFGGSTMWGSGVDDRGTIPAVFNRQNPTYRVHNHGETGFNSRQHIANLVSLYSQGERTDVAVFYDGIADVSNLCRVEISIVGHDQEANIRAKIEGQRGAARYLGALYTIFFDRIVGFITMLTNPEGHKEHFVCASDPARARLVASTLVNNWITAHALVTARGGRFIALLQPVAYLGSPRLDHLTQAMETRRFLGEQIKVTYPLVRELMRGHDYMFDISDAYDGDEYIYNDFAHVSSNGNAIIASRVATVLEE